MESESPGYNLRHLVNIVIKGEMILYANNFYANKANKTLKRWYIKPLILFIVIYFFGNFNICSAQELFFKEYLQSQVIGILGNGFGELKDPNDIAVDSTNGEIYIVNRGNRRVEVFSKATKVTADLISDFSCRERPSPDDGQPQRQIAVNLFRRPECIAVDENFVYLSGSGFDDSPSTPAVAILQKDGRLIRYFSEGIENPQDLAVDNTGALYVVDLHEGLSEILKFSADGEQLSSFSGIPPWNFYGHNAHITIEPIGQNLYIADGWNIYIFDINGRFIKQIDLFNDFKYYEFQKNTFNSYRFSSDVEAGNIGTDGNGNVYVAISDSIGHYLLRINQTSQKNQFLLYVLQQIPDRQRKHQSHFSPSDYMADMFCFVDSNRTLYFLYKEQGAIRAYIPRDIDEDGIPDDIEINGFDYSKDGIIDLDFPSLGANPCRKDIYLEVDYLVSDGDEDGRLDGSHDHTHAPNKLAIRKIVEAFADAPITNMDGTTGVQLHIDTGNLYDDVIVEQVPGKDGLSGTFGDLGGGGDAISEKGNEIIDFNGDIGNPGTNFFELKKAYSESIRDSFFRYAIFAHQTNSRKPVNDCTSGVALIKDFLVTLGGQNDSGKACWGPNKNGYSVGSINQQASTLMHELGHTLGLKHGGGDNINYKQNYWSIMNYRYPISCQVPTGSMGIVEFKCDYSRYWLPSLNEKSLDECLGVDGKLIHDLQLGFAPVDFSGNGKFEGLSCGDTDNTNADINFNDTIEKRCVGPGQDKTLTTMPDEDDIVVDGFIQNGLNQRCDTRADQDAENKDEQLKVVGEYEPYIHNGYNDWVNLIYNFRLFSVEIGSVNFGIKPALVDEPDPETQKIAKALLRATSQPKLLLNTEYSNNNSQNSIKVVVKNDGRGPAFNVKIDLSTPTEMQQSIEIGTITAGQSIIHDFEIRVPDENCIDTISNLVVVRYQAESGDVLEASDEQIIEGICSEKKLCTTLGNRWNFYRQNVNFYTFFGKKGENIKISLAAADNLPFKHYKQVELTLLDKIFGIKFFKKSKGKLPEKIVTKLPATGKYLIVVKSKSKIKLDYCLTMESTDRAWQTLISGCQTDLDDEEDITPCTIDDCDYDIIQKSDADDAILPAGSDSNITSRGESDGCFITSIWHKNKQPEF